ncbi:MAG: cysteine synthase A [Candidatus Gastranaerophilales bacterium]|nr:cysteine synthase A [Candidatus Gastranaerophilales bacterium]
MKVAKSLCELTGNTPLVEINKLNKEGYAKIYAKLECFNPANSIKDRVALNMIKEAEKRGEISPEKTVIIEPTSGNTGIGLAWVCAIKGYRLIITMPDTMSIERRVLMKAYGAELILTEGTKGMKGAIEKAEELHKEIKDSIIAGQFVNPDNPMAHEKTTAVEILNDTDKKVDILVAGVGTGGTITGISRAIKKELPNFKAIAVEPATSAVLSGEPSGPHKIQGIGAGFIPKTLDVSILDEIIKVKDEDAIETAKNLAKYEGILCGISSGAAMFGALEVSKRPENKDKIIVVILPDYGERYLSSVLFEDLKQ